MNETEQWLILNMLPGVGPLRCQELLRHFGSPQRILDAEAEELRDVPGIGERTATEIVRFRNRVRIEEEMAKIEKEKVTILTLAHENYPANLKSIPDPPVVLYVKGELLPEDRIAIGMVGTRRPTNYGKMVAEKLSKELAERKITVVSGLARGIDSCSHRGAIAGKGRTVAVLGSGIDICYPPENRELLKEISEHGAVISEFPMGTAPEKGNFPRRNRVISGLSLGVVIVEAGNKSGALITADYALEHGREVFAVPGSIFNQQSKGTHLLIKQGAKLVESCEDIVAEIDVLATVFSQAEGSVLKREAKQELTSEEEKIYSILTFEPVHIDVISREAGLPVNRLSPLLMGLEMKGKIKQIAGMMFLRVPEKP